MANGRSALAGFMVKELRHILRDRQTLLVLLLLPLAMVVLFGFALRNEVNSVRIAFVDPARDYATTALRNRFAGNGRFEVVGVSQRIEPVEELFRKGDADVALVFDEEFASDLSKGLPARVFLISDASDPNTGSMLQSYSNAVIAAYAREIGANQPVEIVPFTRMRYNPMLKSANLFVPGLIALVLTMVTALMTAISLSREKERGTLEVLLVSPLHPWQIIIGKVLPYLLLAFANVATVLIAAYAVFRVPFRGSVALLLFASLLYAMVSLALGVLIASRTDSQRAAMLAAMLITMMPNMLLSGMVFPLASLPGWLYPLTFIVPARWFIVISRGVMLKGAGLSHLWPSMAALSVMLLVLLVAAIRSFKPRLA